MQAVVNDILTTYEKSGKGPALLMLHGWGDSQDTYKQLSKQLQSNYTVITLDLPGFGQTEIPPNAWDLGDYAHFIKAFLDKINANPKFLMAHSNGGAVAILGLSQGVLTADKLVLLASAGIRDQQSLRRFSLKIIAKAGKIATFWLPVKHKQVLQKKFYGSIGSDMLVVPHMQETFKNTVRQDIQDEAKQLSLPTLLIYGGSDKATPARFGEIFNSLIKSSRLEILPGAGHFVHHDQPEKVAGLVKEFLK